MTTNQLYSQGDQLNNADKLAMGLQDDTARGSKLLKELKWRLFKEKLCMYMMILVRTLWGHADLYILFVIAYNICLIYSLSLFLFFFSFLFLGRYFWEPISDWHFISFIINV